MSFEGMLQGCTSRATPSTMTAPRACSVHSTATACRSAAAPGTVRIVAIPPKRASAKTIRTRASASPSAIRATRSAQSPACSATPSVRSRRVHYRRDRSSCHWGHRANYSPQRRASLDCSVPKAVRGAGPQPAARRSARSTIRTHAPIWAPRSLAPRATAGDTTDHASKASACAARTDARSGSRC